MVRVRGDKGVMVLEKFHQEGGGFPSPVWDISSCSSFSTPLPLTEEEEYLWVWIWDSIRRLVCGGGGGIEENIIQTDRCTLEQQGFLSFIPQPFFSYTYRIQAISYDYY